MPNKEHSEWRKKQIKEIKSGSGISDLTVKKCMDIINSILEDLESSIDKISRAANRLSLVLVIATVIMALVAIGNLYIAIAK